MVFVNLKGKDVRHLVPARVAGAVPAASRSTEAARAPGDPPRPGPSTSPRPHKRLHRPRPPCDGDERSTLFFPGERRQTVSPGESQSGEARAATEVETGTARPPASRSLRHGLRSGRQPGLRGVPAASPLVPPLGLGLNADSSRPGDALTSPGPIRWILFSEEGLEGSDSARQG